MSQQITEIVALPLTWAEIKAQFDGKVLRESIYAECCSNGVANARQVALTAGGRASLAAVNVVARTEYADRGYDKCYVGEGEDGEITAFRDQPRQD